MHTGRLGLVTFLLTLTAREAPCLRTTLGNRGGDRGMFAWATTPSSWSNWAWGYRRIFYGGFEFGLWNAIVFNLFNLRYNIGIVIANAIARITGGFVEGGRIEGRFAGGRRGLRGRTDTEAR